MSSSYRSSIPTTAEDFMKYFYGKHAKKEQPEGSKTEREFDQPILDVKFSFGHSIPFDALRSSPAVNPKKGFTDFPIVYGRDRKESVNLDYAVVNALKELEFEDKVLREMLGLNKKRAEAVQPPPPPNPNNRTLAPQQPPETVRSKPEINIPAPPPIISPAFEVPTPPTLLLDTLSSQPTPQNIDIQWTEPVRAAPCISEPEYTNARSVLEPIIVETTPILVETTPRQISSAVRVVTFQISPRPSHPEPLDPLPEAPHKDPPPQDPPQRIRRWKEVTPLQLINELHSERLETSREAHIEEHTDQESVSLTQIVILISIVVALMVTLGVAGLVGLLLEIQTFNQHQETTCTVYLSQVKVSNCSSLVEFDIPTEEGSCPTRPCICYSTVAQFTSPLLSDGGTTQVVLISNTVYPAEASATARTYASGNAFPCWATKSDPTEVSLTERKRKKFWVPILAAGFGCAVLMILVGIWISISCRNSASLSEKHIDPGILFEKIFSPKHRAANDPEHIRHGLERVKSYDLRRILRRGGEDI